MALLGVLCGGVVAQQFRIAEYSDGNITIEYPPSFDGAYLFIDQSTNLAANVWDTVDYSTVSLVQGETVLYSPLVESSSGESNNPPTEVPYEITPEYIMAVANGEIENSEWAASTVWNSAREGASGFYRIMALSFVDSDGDGIDNVTEYALNSNPYTNDAPAIAPPADDGDPRSVPGSVDSAPGDWNTPPQNFYRATGSPYEAINMRILAMDGTNGTFTVETSATTLGAWVEAQCGTWQATASGELYPTVSGGRFYRTPKDGFSWVGKEQVFALALNAYDGSESFINHLVQASPSDPAGLALLSDGTPLLVDASNLWTEEKLSACLKHLVTVECRFQQVENDMLDPSDITAMAYAELIGKSTIDYLTRRDYVQNINYCSSESTAGDDGWGLDFCYIQKNGKYTFLDQLQSFGFGPTIHRGYASIDDRGSDWELYDEGYFKYTVMESITNNLSIDGTINKTFTKTDNETAWHMVGDVDYNAAPPLYGALNCPNPEYGGFHTVGYVAEEIIVLSTLDPPASSDQTLVMDCDRNGTISTNDWSRVDESHPYRFWVNEDGNEANYPEANYPEADMEDFFPAMFTGTESNQTFKLSANIALDYIPTTMTASNSMEYLHDIDLAQTLSGQIQTLELGNQTTQTFDENELVLIAASGVITNAELYVHILENGSEVEISTNHFSFTSITNMYRTKNLRTNGVSFVEEPSNWPDELTNDKDFVFIHGFNVNETAGRDWNADIFKRLWHSGSNAKFHGILWDGTPDSLGSKKHYHHSVIHAFATAPALASYLNGLNSPVVAAHSLGNMVTGSAICDHGATVNQYYAMNSAVALEAYGDVAPHTNMVPDSVFAVHDNGWFIPGGRKYRWNEYPFESWASEWYQLFPTNDVRSELTWRHRFLSIQQETDVFNFYSSTEEILRVDDEITILDLVNIDIDLWMHFLPVDYDSSVQYAWQIQEQYKGLDQLPLINAPGGGVSKYGGWGFVKKDSQHIESRWAGLLGHGPVKPRTVEESLDPAHPTDRAAYRASLQSDPLFRQEPEELFQSGALAFASGKVGDNGGNLDYNVGDNGMDISGVLIRDWLLAKAFPSRTRPMGSTSVRDIGGGWKDVNFNMSHPTEGFMTNLGQWYDDEDEYNGQPVWHHSDFRDAPYVHVYKLFEKITTKEN